MTHNHPVPRLPLLGLAAATILVAGCGSQIIEGPAGRPTTYAPTATASSNPQRPTSQVSASTVRPKPTPAPVTRPTPYPIPQRPDTGVSPLAPRPDQPLWQRSE